MQDCLPCSQYSVASVVGAVSCQVCQAGTYYTWSAPDFSDGVCTQCAIGYSSGIDARTCNECAAGSYAGRAGSDTCSACRPGTYQDTVGAAGCKPCDIGKYTYVLDSSGNGGVYNAVWSATSSAQCVTLPSSTAPLICLPGTYMDGSVCVACPLGYYCPEVTESPADVNSIRACPAGSMSARTGALAIVDCELGSMLEPFVFSACGIAPGGVGALDQLVVTAMTTSRSTSTLFLTTATVVYRLFLDKTVIEVLAGEEGSTGAPTTNAIGVLARFTSLTAIAVDLDGPEAGIIVVGDSHSVRMLNVFSREVTLLGNVYDVDQAGGIALRRESSSGARIAYVSDSLQHRIMAFNLDNFRSFLIAGSNALVGYAGKVDGGYGQSMFRRPKGLAFLEKAMNSSKMLLVADSGNNRIRVIDTDTWVTSTWFSPLDKVAPELVNPISINVAVTNSPQATTIVYVTDAAGGVSAIQFPVSSDTSIKVLTKMISSSSISAAFAHGSMSVGVNNAVGYAELLVLESGTSRARVLDALALTDASTVGETVAGQCHLPCVNSDCSPLTPAALCGNSFLDDGEQCDDGFSNPNTGCNMSTCTIEQGFTCPVNVAACHEPYKAYVYAPTGVSYREVDCLALTPRSGYTIDNHCVETDIDECVEGTAVLCNVQAKCINTEGSYTCQCFDSYFGDGQTCHNTAYAVYSIVDIRSLAAAVLTPPLSSNSELVLHLLHRAYAQSLSALLPSNAVTAFSLVNASTLAQQYTSSSLDPAVTTFCRLEVVTLFETSTDAAMVASTLDAASMSIALSQALFDANTGVSVFQKPKVRVHRAMGFTAPNVIDGWGMNITSVTYNRTCVVPGVTPTGGCWQVEMIYIGGQELPESNENTNVIQQSKNVLYLPRLEHDPVTMELSPPIQGLTMNSGMSFPCDVKSASASGEGINSQATACCLRNMESTYRPHAGFREFVESIEFAGMVPMDTCMGADGSLPINDTFPLSDIVFALPGNDGTNDLVVGPIEGMPHSEVKLLETIDYTTRTFKVLLVLEEGDLRQHASLMDGIWGLEYNLTFFVGLANFKGTGTSVLNTRNSVEFITVSKSSVLTISTFGANQDPLVSSVDMQLNRIKVTDFFRPISYLYYLQPVFTLPSNFQTPEVGGVVPTNSIRLIKTQGLPTNTDPGWMQACSNVGGDYVYANTSLQALVQRAQSQPCVQTNLQICYPPSKASSVVTFGIPLPIDFIQSTDYDDALNPYTLNVQFVIQATDKLTKSKIYSTLSMSVDITPMGFTATCETMSAAQNLADIIEGNIYIGTATNDYEWDSQIQKKINIDVQGATPSNSFEFATTTVQGAIMSFVALGDPKYFEDPRSLEQTVNIHDVHTVHFLEPLGSKAGPSPSYDAVKLLFLAGKAFIPKMDAAKHSEWLEPSKELLRLCPYKATAGKMSCLTRTESTFKNTELVRNAQKIIELRQNDTTSIDEMKNLIAEVMFQGGANPFTEQLGAGFYNELSTKLALNNRYRKAYVINPIMDWSFEAMQGTQKGSTAYTVCSKIIAIGMITIRTPSGTQLVRRLLSTEMLNDPLLLRGPPPSLPMLQMRYYNDDEEESGNNNGSRKLLQTTTTTNENGPSMTQTGNAMVLNLDVPGFDGTTQLCSMVLGATYDKCNIVELQTVITGGAALNMCMAHDAGTLGPTLNSGLSNVLRDTTNTTKLVGVAVIQYTADGCAAINLLLSSAGGRRLLTSDVTTAAAVAAAASSGEFKITLTQKVIVSSSNGEGYLKLAQLRFIDNFLNTTTYSTLIGGGGYLSSVTITFPDTGEGIIEIIVKNMTNTTKDDLQKILDQNPPLSIHQGDTMFVNDYYAAAAVAKASSAGAGSRAIVLLINVLAASCLGLLLF